MRIFVTGASGWIGSAVVPELLSAGHQVIGLARSQASADALSAAGVTPHPGGLDDLESLRSGAQDADGVIHLAFKHDFSDYAGAGRTERAAMTTLAEALVGSDRPLLFASGLAGISSGRPATEHDLSPFSGPDAPRGGAEGLAAEYAERGVRTVRLRFAPTVHGEGDHGFTATLAAVARATGVAGYVGDGVNRWAAVHRGDAARLVALALESSPAGSAVHAAGEEGVETRSIAEALGAALDVPVRSIDPAEATGHFGWIGTFFGMDAAASSTLTRQALGWTPTGPTLLEDIAAGFYPGR
ncbi:MULTISPECIES: SDR family oxidoreductase [unclassified Rathayibacter]|uniref:SDR family oxidoreductase n=1 Tax=unclassified Rathayibacter TaxID=2609250 RepID=UPI0006F41AD0|nr:MULTISPECIES: SDR family oxidoreductase [unclassified Rathayibacter]KQQ01379.1 3-beta hydroxysteroid dehydrogenase [Rathayibacter sp. Leaf294]KQS11410.1 3-beta hydroxysteroid dehydrogenase [Rathayibacter sp. Leaf185]